MGATLIIELCIGAIFFGPSAVMALVLTKYGADSPMWEWLLWGAISTALMGFATLVLFASHKATGRDFPMPALLINLGLCLVTGGFVWHISKGVAVTNEYLYFDVDLAAGATPNGYPGRIFNLAPSTFSNVIAWFSPEAGRGIADPQNETNPYWSLRYLQVAMPILHSGGPRTGKFIPMGYYFVQCNATYKDISYYFRELLEIREYDGSVIQLIDVWRTTPATGELVKVYTSDRPAALRDNREPF